MDSEVFVLVDRRSVFVRCVIEHNIRVPHFTTALDDTRPNLTFSFVTSNHFLHPLISDRHAVCELLDRISFRSNVEELHDVSVLSWQVRWKVSTPDWTLRHDVNQGFKELHEVHRARGMTVSVSNLWAPCSHCAKIPRTPAAVFTHHPYLSVGVQDIPHVVVHVRTKTTDWQAFFHAVVWPHWWSQWNPPFAHVFIHFVRKTILLKVGFCFVSNDSDSLFCCLTFGQVSSG